MTDLKKENYLQILFIFSITILVSALIIEYILGYEPCSLCIVERIPYVLAIIILILNYTLKKKSGLFQYFINISFFIFNSDFCLPLWY